MCTLIGELDVEYRNASNMLHAMGTGCIYPCVGYLDVHPHLATGTVIVVISYLIDPDWAYYYFQTIE